MRSAAARSAAKKGEGATPVEVFAAAAAALTVCRRSCARCAAKGSAVKRPADKRTAHLNLRMYPPSSSASAPYDCGSGFDDKPRALRLPAEAAGKLDSETRRASGWKADEGRDINPT